MSHRSAVRPYKLFGGPGIPSVLSRWVRAAYAFFLIRSTVGLANSPIHKNLLHRKEVKLVPVDFRPRNYFDFDMRSTLQEQIAEGVNLVHTHQTSLLGSIVPWVWNQPQVALFASRHIMNDHD